MGAKCNLENTLETNLHYPPRREDLGEGREGDGIGDPLSAGKDQQGVRAVAAEGSEEAKNMEISSGDGEIWKICTPTV